MQNKIDRWTQEKIILNQQVLRQLIYKDFDKMREAAKKHKEVEKQESLPGWAT
jgi:hypothetical protein